jgi:hypothetical protein
MTTTKRSPVHCPTRKHTNGKHVLLAKIGVNPSGTEGLYLWCGKCKEEHFLSLVQIMKTLEEMQEGDTNE